MKLITEHEVEGGWSSLNHVSKCRNCGAITEFVPKEGHYNSKYWVLQRNDGLFLKCCPNGCSEKEATRKMKRYLLFRLFCTKNSESWNYRYDFSKIEDGFISNKGVFYPCNYDEHKSLIYELEEQLNIKYNESTWIKFSEDKFYFTHNRLNKKQNGAIAYICTEKGLKFNESIE